MRSGSRQAAYAANWNKVMETLTDNVALQMVVLHEEFGFGKDRINRLLEAMAAKAKKFDEWEADEVLDGKREKMTENFESSMHEFLKVRCKGVLPDDIYSEFFEKALPQAAAMQAKFKRNTESARVTVSLSEAANMQAKVRAMRDFIGKGGE